jgi:hypothetical protein
MAALSLNDRRMVTVSAPDNGCEVIWAEHVSKDRYRVLSVPVFAYGISRGTTLVAKEQINGDQLNLERIVHPSEGATIRCYVREGLLASKVYLEQMVPSGSKMGLEFGPATFFDPEIVAFHVHSRRRWQDVGRYCDELVRKQVLKFWELGDPDADGVADEQSVVEPWVVVHQPPGDSPGVSLIRT